jgi:hypothetical protein
MSPGNISSFPARAARLRESVFSIVSQKQISCRYKIANHEETSLLAYLLFTPAGVWLAA